MTNNIRKHWLATLSLVCLALFTGQSQAGSKDFGEFQVHWSVFPSTFLAPKIASEYNLNRSRSIGIVNISIMREGEQSGLEPVSGQVEGKVLNDVQQIKFLGFRRVQEGNAVYFISEYQYGNAELMTFEITARPTGSDEELPVRFTHTLFND
ncbi:DUF4426 domain-containing protein [Marinobacter sp. 71-i]|uniref:DUF4426 domain-containing protein n=1 Tax=Marinobacter iranensis TaxID=2962607 RepID=A0ABT5YA12_9GAMM|nr:DUF4426 domain-containing protein [Marinobacter iranensis]MDF0749950.1 DUF4426 domain-containing protein [Marinobacter iranensis]